jgi:hypothetical protein
MARSAKQTIAKAGIESSKSKLGILRKMSA